MNKNFIRAVSLLLIPCLLADFSYATALNTLFRLSVSPFNQFINTTSFNDQALELPFVAARRHLLHWKPALSLLAAAFAGGVGGMVWQEDGAAESLERARQAAESALRNGRRDRQAAVAQSRKLIFALNTWANGKPDAEKLLSNALAELAIWASDHYSEEMDRIPLLVWGEWDGTSHAWVFDFFQRWMNHNRTTKFRAIWFLFHRIQDIPGHTLFDQLRKLLVAQSAQAVLPDLIEALCSMTARQLQANSELIAEPFPRRKTHLEDEITSLETSRDWLLSLLLNFTDKECDITVHQIIRALEKEPLIQEAKEAVTPALVAMGVRFPEKVVPVLFEELMDMAMERKRVKGIYKALDATSTSAKTLRRRLDDMELVKDVLIHTIDGISEHSAELDALVERNKFNLLQQLAKESDQVDALTRLVATASTFTANQKEAKEHTAELIAALKNWPKRLSLLDQDPLIDALAALSAQWDDKDQHAILNDVWIESTAHSSQWFWKFFEVLISKYQTLQEVADFLLLDQLVGHPMESFPNPIRQLLLEAGYKHPEVVLNAVIEAKKRSHNSRTNDWLEGFVLNLVLDLAIRQPRARPTQTKPGPQAAPKVASPHAIEKFLINHIDPFQPGTTFIALKKVHGDYKPVHEPNVLDDSTLLWISNLIFKIAATSKPQRDDILKVLTSRRHPSRRYIEYVIDKLRSLALFLAVIVGIVGGLWWLGHHPVVAGSDLLSASVSLLWMWFALAGCVGMAVSNPGLGDANADNPDFGTLLTPLHAEVLTFNSQEDDQREYAIFQDLGFYRSGEGLSKKVEWMRQHDKLESGYWLRLSQPLPLMPPTVERLPKSIFNRFYNFLTIGLVVEGAKTANDLANEFSSVLVLSHGAAPGVGEAPGSSRTGEPYIVRPVAEIHLSNLEEFEKDNIYTIDDFESWFTLHRKDISSSLMEWRERERLRLELNAYQRLGLAYGAFLWMKRLGNEELLRRLEPRFGKMNELVVAFYATVWLSFESTLLDIVTRAKLRNTRQILSMQRSIPRLAGLPTDEQDRLVEEFDKLAWQSDGFDEIHKSASNALAVAVEQVDALRASEASSQGKEPTPPNFKNGEGSQNAEYALLLAAVLGLASGLWWMGHSPALQATMMFTFGGIVMGAIYTRQSPMLKQKSLDAAA